MRLYKFLKPSQSVALVGDEIAFANKCNLLGAKSWKSNAKELHTFIRGDVKKRTDLKEKIKKSTKNISRKSLLLLRYLFSIFTK